MTAALASAATTTITGTITGILGAGWQGVVGITASNSCTPTGGGIIALSRATVDMSNSSAGTFQHADGTAVVLAATDICSETGTHYKVRYRGRTGGGWEETWSVPTGASVAIEDIRTSTTSVSAGVNFARVTGCVAKGSMLVGNATTLACQAVGTNDFAWIADSAQATGGKWASISATLNAVLGYSGLSNANYLLATSSTGTAKEAASTGTTQLGTKFYFDATNLMFEVGGTTNSFPALKRSSAELQFRFADDSGYTDFRANQGFFDTIAADQASVYFAETGTVKWQLGKQNDGGHTFFLYDQAATQNVMTIATGSGPVFPQGIFSTSIDGVDAGASATRSNENKILIARHNTDCTALTDGVAGELCYEEDSNNLYMCEPSAGGCDTAGEWILTSGGGGVGSSSDTEIAWNNSGTLDGTSTFTTDGSKITGTNVLDMSGGTLEVPQNTVGGLPGTVLGQFGIITDGDDGDDVATGSGAVPVPYFQTAGTTYPITWNLTAGGSGALTAAGGASGVEVEIVTAVLATKAAANVWTGATAFQGVVNFCADSVGTDSYACSISPAIASLTTGACYTFSAGTANTDGAGINFNAIGAKDIHKMHNQALITGDIEAGQIVVVCYDGAEMQMTSQLAQ